jgi:CheY-like chemotaxis protein
MSGVSAAPQAGAPRRDNEDARESLRRLMEVAGHRVSAAPDGVSGLERAIAGHPDALAQLLIKA